MEKMIPIQIIPGMRGWGIKENDGGLNSSVIYLIHCRIFCKFHNEPPPSPIFKKGDHF
jgi:hypothetical protein